MVMFFPRKYSEHKGKDLKVRNTKMILDYYFQQACEQISSLFLST
jgi:hypothetical protein